MGQTAPTDYRIEPLGKRHDRSSFESGVPLLDSYLKRQAGQDQKRHIANPFVLLKGDSNQVIGYYTLSATSIEVDELSDEQQRRLPHYPFIPATLLGRLAVDQKFQGHRLGTALMANALRRSWQASVEIASYAVAVDAKDEAARLFYEHFGFLSYKSEPLRLFLPMKTIAVRFS